MKHDLRDLLAVLLGICSLIPTTDADRVCPIDRAAELLTNLQQKIEQDGDNEFSAYQENLAWCSESSTEKKQEVLFLTKEKSKLKASLDKSVSDIQDCTDQIEELSTSISSKESKLKVATDVREGESQSFNTAEANLMDAMDALDMAVQVLSKAQTSQPAALLQDVIDIPSIQRVLVGFDALIDAADVANNASKPIAALQEQAQDPQTPPDADAYKKRSGAIVEVIEDMKEKAQKQLHDLRDVETAAQHDFDILKASIEDQIQVSTKEVNGEKKSKAQSSSLKANLAGSLDKVSKQLATAQSSLKDVQDTCMERAASHEEAVKGRKEELAAISEAKKAVQEALSLIQQRSSYLFFQELSRSSQASKQNLHTRLQGRKVVQILQKLAASSHSHELSQLSSRIAASIKYSISGTARPFEGVIATIKNMIERLEHEQKEDMSEKAYCDSDMAKTQRRTDELTDQAEDLKGRIDLAVSKSTRLKVSVKRLQAEVRFIDKAQADLAKARESEHAAYESQTADLKQSIASIRVAIRVLREYYASDDEKEAASMLQRSDSLRSDMEQPEPPKKYAKSSSAGASMIHLLDLLESDLASYLAKCDTDESSSQSEFENLVLEDRMLKKKQVG